MILSVISGTGMILYVTCLLHLLFRASELAFALDRLPKDELPPSPPFTEVHSHV